MIDLDRVDDRVRTAVGRRIKWRDVDMSLPFTLTRHEIMLGKVVCAETEEGREEAYHALQKCLEEEGGWHGNKELGRIELQPGDYFVIKCSKCGLKHRGIIEGGPVIGRVICPVKEAEERCVEEAA